MKTEEKGKTELTLSETASRHGVSESELREAVRENRPVGDGLNLDRYAENRNGEILFSFPSWYAYPTANEAEAPAPRDEPRGNTGGEEPEEAAERRPRSSGKTVGRKAAEAAGVLGVALLLGSALSD